MNTTEMPSTASPAPSLFAVIAVIAVVAFIHQGWALANVQRAINAALEEGGCEEGE